MGFFYVQNLTDFFDVIILIEITIGKTMYVKINNCQYNLISLLFVLDSATEYYLDDYHDFDSKESRHRKYSVLIEIINNDETNAFIALIADEIEYLSGLALKRPYDNNDIITLISILNGYLTVVRYGNSLREIFSDFDYLNVKEFCYRDYSEDITSDSDDEQHQADICSSTEQVEKDFFKEPELENDDFEFENDFEETKPSKAGESWIRKPKAND